MCRASAFDPRCLVLVCCAILLLFIGDKYDARETKRFRNNDASQDPAELSWIKISQEVAEKLGTEPLDICGKRPGFKGQKQNRARMYNRHHGNSTSSRKASHRMNGGKTVEYGEYPSYAHITGLNHLGARFTCGGVLIGKRTVLSASHCATTMEMNSVKVTLGFNPSFESQSKEMVQIVGVQRACHHDQFCLYTMGLNQLLIFDLLVLSLDRDVEYNDVVQPICVPIGSLSDISYRYRNDETFRIVGRGYTWNHVLTVDGPIRAIDVSPNWCASSTDNVYNKVHATVKCYGSQGEGNACGGDSGGPVVYYRNDMNGQERQFLSGVVSTSVANCNNRDPWPHTAADLLNSVQAIHDMMISSTKCKAPYHINYPFKMCDWIYGRRG